MRPTQAIERDTAGQHDLVAFEDDMADTDVRMRALVLKVMLIPFNLGHQVLLVHQLDQHRVAGPDMVQLDRHPAMSMSSGYIADSSVKLQTAYRWLLTHTQ